MTDAPFTEPLLTEMLDVLSASLHVQREIRDLLARNAVPPASPASAPSFLTDNARHAETWRFFDGVTKGLIDEVRDIKTRLQRLETGDGAP